MELSMGIYDLLFHLNWKKLMEQQIKIDNVYLFRNGLFYVFTEAFRDMFTFKKDGKVYNALNMERNGFQK